MMYVLFFPLKVPALERFFRKAKYDTSQKYFFEIQFYFFLKKKGKIFLERRRIVLCFTYPRCHLLLGRS